MSMDVRDGSIDSQIGEDHLRVSPILRKDEEDNITGC